MEKIINKRLLWYLETKQLLNKNQCGFRNDRCTLDVLTTVTTEIETAFTNKQHLIAVFFDIEKAFETVWNYRIIKKLQEMNAQGHTLHFIKNFLENRKFKTKFNGIISTEKNSKKWTATRYYIESDTISDRNK